MDSVLEARNLFAVNLAITGSVQPADSGVRLTANLVDAPNLRQLRSVTMDLRTEEIADLQDGVVHRVIELLEIELNVDAEEALSAGGTQKPRAYELYIQGVGYLQRFDREGNVEAAIESLEAAAEEDPDYAPAHSGLAEAYWQKYNQTSQKEWAERAVAAAERAVALNGHLAVSRAKLGEMYRRTSRPDEAIKELERALDLDPLNAEARLSLAGVFRSRNENTQADELLVEAVRLRPDYWKVYSNLGVHYERTGRYEQAAEAFRQAVDLAPDNELLRRNLALAYFKLGRIPEARAQLQRSIEIQPSAGAYDILGVVEFFAGRFDQSRRAFQEAVDMQPGNYFRWGQLAEALRWTPGHQDEAPQAYAKAIELARERVAVGSSDWATHRRIALYQAKTGDIAGARKTFSEIPEESRQSAAMHYYDATIHELAGDRDRAIAALRRAVEARYAVAEVVADPELAALRESPEGRRLMREIAAKE